MEVEKRRVVWDHNIQRGWIRLLDNSKPHECALDSEGREILFGAYGQDNSRYHWDIHHRDGNRKNNQVNNLQVIHRDSHNGIHN